MSQRRAIADLEVLIVDDEEFSRSIVARILRKLNVKRIRAAADGFEGLEHLRYPNHVDVVVLDFHMPRMNGLEMLKQIRDGSAGVERDTLVAMLTGHGDARLVGTAMALDVNAFLVKPTSLSVIADRLGRMLDEPPEIKPAPVYRRVDLPGHIWLSSDVPLRRDPQVSFVLPEDARVVSLQLENIPVNARLAEDVIGPDGDLLMPAGTVLTQRLLSRLADLRMLDDCVARLPVAFPKDA